MKFLEVMNKVKQSTRKKSTALIILNQIAVNDSFSMNVAKVKADIVTKQFDAMITELDAIINTNNSKAKSLKQDYVGLDKSVVSNIAINAIDFDKLTACNNVRIFKENKANASITTLKPDLTTGELVQYSNIYIEDNNLFNQLTISCVLTTGGIVDYTHLTTYVNREETHNLIPYTLQEYKRHLNDIKDHLINEYGILADFSEATFLELEMNVNINTPENFASYQHVLNFLTQNASARYKKTDYKTGQNKFTGTSLKNKSYELKIYDKKEQLKKEYHIDVAETMRFEITISNVSRKSKANFEKLIGTNKIADITQDMINDMYYNLMNSIVFNSYNKQKSVLDKQVIKLAKKHKKADSFIKEMYKLETQSKKIILFAAEQLQSLDIYNQTLSLLAQNQQTAQSDLDFIMNRLNVA